jgi:NAD(P)-dependent dehydrogenase (short-subunit alcohol dehydrogenase family)
MDAIDEAAVHERGTGPRVSLVTGGTDGIGRAVALRLARSGDQVIVVGRHRERGAAVLEALRAMRPGVGHAFIRADLALLGETSRVADEVSRLTARLDAVVCCAGILSARPEWTEEGLERNFVLNYLTRYMLVRRLRPILTTSPSGRVVLVSNAGQYPDTLDLEDLQHRRGKPGLRVAGRTQFANDLLALELADRLRGTRIEVTCVFPGLVKTAVFRNARGFPWILRAIARVLQRVFGASPERAAVTPAYLASPDATGTSGRFYGPGIKQRPLPPRVLRLERRQALWAASEELVRPYLTPPARPATALGGRSP